MAALIYVAIFISILISIFVGYSKFKSARQRLRKKDNEKAFKITNIGNQMYTKGEFSNALLFFNQSLCYAIWRTEAQGVAYTNRSAVYIEMKLFDLCLRDISRARKCNYIDKMEELVQREAECLAAIENMEPNPHEDPFDFFKLSYAAKSKYPGIVDCLALRNNIKFGNHLITTKALKTGDIIGVEEPIFTIANSDARLYRCSYCYKDCFMNMMPCNYCTRALFVVSMFCSEECQETSLSEFHQFECNFGDNPQMKCDFPLRILMKCLNIFDYNVSKFQKFVEKNRKPVTFFDLDMSNPDDEMYQKNIIRIMLSIENTAPHCKVLMDVIEKEVKAFVNCHTKLKQLWENHGKFLNEILKKLVFSVTMLTHTSAYFSRKVNLPTETYFGQVKPTTGRSKMFEQNVGQGLYPAFCLLNGSCDPNVFSVAVSNKLAWIVAKMIPAGAQLFRKYTTPFYNYGPAKHRQSTYRLSFGYTCNCAACKFDWAELSGLQSIDPSFKYNDDQKMSSHEVARENIKKNVEYIEKNYKNNRPTKEVYSSIDYNFYEFSSLANPAWY